MSSARKHDDENRQSSARVHQNDDQSTLEVQPSSYRPLPTHNEKVRTIQRLYYSMRDMSGPTFQQKRAESIRKQKELQQQKLREVRKKEETDRKRVADRERAEIANPALEFQPDPSHEQWWLHLKPSACDGYLGRYKMLKRFRVDSMAWAKKRQKLSMAETAVSRDEVDEANSISAPADDISPLVAAETGSVTQRNDKKVILRLRIRKEHAQEVGDFVVPRTVLEGGTGKGDSGNGMRTTSEEVPAESNIEDFVCVEEDIRSISPPISLLTLNMT